MLSGPQVFHGPNTGLEELLLDGVLVVDDPHALHEAGEVADLGGPEVLQFLGTNVLHVGGPLLTAVVQAVGVGEGRVVHGGHGVGPQEGLGVLVGLHDGHLEGGGG